MEVVVAVATMVKASCHNAYMFRDRQGKNSYRCQLIPPFLVIYEGVTGTHLAASCSPPRLSADYGSSSNSVLSFPPLMLL